MAQFRSLLRFLFSIYAMLVFVVVMLLLFPFVVIVSFYGPVRGGNLVYRLCTIWADIVFFFWGISHRNIYKYPVDYNNAKIFVFNHISYIDIPIMMKIFRHHRIRILGKAEMTKVPIFGFFYKQAVIKVKRDSPEARRQSIRDIKKMLSRNISVVIAPEGTFNMTNQPLKEFYDGAFRIAIQTETPIQPVLILDAYDRMNYNSIFSINPGRSRAVFLKEISPNERDITSLKNEVYQTMERELINFKVSWIKNDGAK